MDLNKMIMIYYMIGGKISDDPTPPDDTEYTITVDSNVDAIFTSDGLNFVNGVAKTKTAGTYEITAQADGYNTEKKSITVNDMNPNGYWYFDLTEQSTDPSEASKAEYSFEITINGETAKGNKEVSAYFNNSLESVSGQVDFISSGKIVVKYLDENFNGHPVSSFDLDLSINGIPDGTASESLVIENPVLTKVDNGVAYYSFGIIDVTMEDESTAPNYSIYVYSNPSGATFSSGGLVFNSGLAEVSSVGEYTVNATKPGYYDKSFVVNVTEENPNAVYEVLLDKAPVEYTITVTANISDANFSSYPYLSFDSNGVAEVYETGAYEIECFANGYIEQRKTVIVDESNKNPSVHFDLEVDYLSAPNVYKLSGFKRNDSTDSNIKIVPVVNNGEFGITNGSGRLGVRAVSRGGVEIPDIGVVKVTAWRNADSSTDLQYETESEYFAKKSLSTNSGFGAQILQLHRSGTVGSSNPTLIGDDRSKYSWLISSNRSIDNVNASASTVLLTKNVAINPCPTFAKAFISSEEDGELNKVTYLASSYWKDEGIYSGIGMNAPEVQNVNLSPFSGDEFSSDGRQVQWVIMEYINANNDVPLEDLYFEIFID